MFVIVSLVAFILRDVFMFFVTANKKLLDLLLLLVQVIAIIIGAVHTSQVYVYRRWCSLMYAPNITISLSFSSTPS